MNYLQRRREQARQTEQKILQAALTLMREQSYDRVSVRDICTAADITTGAFYHHFSSKEDLLRLGFAPLDDYLEGLLAEHPDAPPLARLELLVDGYASFVEEQLGKLTCQYYLYRLSSRDAAALDAGRFSYRAMLDCLCQARQAGLLAPGHTPEEVTQFCMRHFRGIIIDWILHEYRYSLAQRFRMDYALIRRLFHA